MSDFTHYERYHLHEYVYKKDRLYTKTEIDSQHNTSKINTENDITAAKTQLIKLNQTTEQTLQNEINGKITSINNKLVNIDEDADTLKTQLTGLINNAQQTLQNEIDKLKKAAEQSDPADPENNDAIKKLIQTSIHSALTDYHSSLINMINERMKGRVGKKSLTIPKTNHTWIKLLSISDIKGITSLDEVLIQDIYISR